MDTAAKYSRLQDVMQDYAPWVRSSARRVLPFVGVSGRSVVDFGCGRGDWLAVAQELGAAEVLGLDGFAAEGADLPVPFRQMDLTAPAPLGRRYDLALCLEVGEHLDAAHAPDLVAALVAAAPVVLFSAAAPGQGGVHHVNEQPPGYWHALFQARGYTCFDFRREVWGDAEVEPWYRMGVLVYAALGAEFGPFGAYRVAEPLHLVHPDIFAAYATTGRDLVLRYDKEKARWWPDMLP